MKFLIVSLLLLCCSWAVHAVAIFEDYLAMIEPESEEEITEAPSEDDGSGSELTSLFSMSCCDLGQLAGQKGFHCNPEYYKRNMQMRNRNRSHNEKMGFHVGEETEHKFSLTLMRQFRKCVGGFSQRFENEFHKCCKYAYMDDDEKIGSKSKFGSSSSAAQDDVKNMKQKKSKKKSRSRSRSRSYSRSTTNSQ